MTIRDQPLVATIVTIAALGLAACGGDAEGAEQTNDVEPAATGYSGIAVAGASPGGADEGLASPSEPYPTPTDQGAVAAPSARDLDAPHREEAESVFQPGSSTPDQPDSERSTDPETRDEPDVPPADGDEQEEPSSDERHAMTAYQESWDATFEALDPPRELPRLEELLTGQALAETLDIIESRAERGTRVEGSLETHPTVVSSSTNAVVLDDCGVENSTEYNTDGEVVDMADNAAYSYRVLVVHDGGSWKAAEINRRHELCEPA